MNNFIKPVDSLINDNNDFFYADKKMHELLKNNDIQLYLDYVKLKYKLNNQENKQENNQENNQENKQENKQIIYQKYSNKYKIDMLESMWTSILNLENTLNKYSK
jgi:hypothetical protein